LIVSARGAIELYLKTVEVGQGVSAHNLGTLYGTGLPGLEPDQELCKYYYKETKSMGAQLADDDFNK
jgi:hypothetical protein